MEILWFWLIFLVCILLGLIIFLTIYISQIINKQKSYELINNSVNEYINSSNFKFTNIFYLYDPTLLSKKDIYKKQILINNNNKQILFIDYNNGSLIKVGFNEILSYEIYENGGTTTEGGSFGGVFGGIFGAETNSNVKELKLIIRLNRIDKSQITYEILSSTLLGITKSSSNFATAMSSLQEVVSFLEVLINNNKEQSKKSKRK